MSTYRYLPRCGLSKRCRDSDVARFAPFSSRTNYDMKTASVYDLYQIKGKHSGGMQIHRFVVMSSLGDSIEPRLVLDRSASLRWPGPSAGLAAIEGGKLSLMLMPMQSLPLVPRPGDTSSNVARPTGCTGAYFGLGAWDDSSRLSKLLSWSLTLSSARRTHCRAAWTAALERPDSASLASG